MQQRPPGMNNLQRGPMGLPAVRPAGAGGGRPGPGPQRSPMQNGLGGGGPAFPQPQRRTAVQPRGGVMLQRPTAGAVRQSQTIALGNLFGDRAGTGRGAGNYKCMGEVFDNAGNKRLCGEILMPGIGEYRGHNGEGPFCENCYSHTWGQHHIGNLDTQPMHPFGIRWKDHELEALNGHINSFVSQVVHGTGKYPTADAVTASLGAMNFKYSVKCMACSKKLRQDINVVFTPTADDFVIPGVNAPLQ